MSDNTSLAVTILGALAILFGTLAFVSQTNGCQMEKCQSACGGAVHAFRTEHGAPVCECVR